MITAPHRPLPPMPRHIAALPVHRGFPVPFFVAWPNGVPDFRVVDARKHDKALRENRCMVCGQRMGQLFAFPLGPMCAVNRVSSEAPSHVECVDWSARACPFLSRPNMVRREGGLPSESREAAGVALRRNPGVALVWVTTSFKTFDVQGGRLFQVGDPKRVVAYREGRLATPEEVIESVASGFPLLADAAAKEGREAVAELAVALYNSAEVLGVDLTALRMACVDAMSALGAQG